MAGITTVIVEDDPMVLEVNRRYVEAVEGFCVVGLAESVREGVALVTRLAPQLAIIDVYLPDGSGLEVLREFRRRGLATDVIMVTAARDVDTVRTALRLGAIDYLVKPFHFVRFRSALESYRRIYWSLHCKTALGQEEIDDLVRPGKRQDGGEYLPKGLAEVTMKQVLALLAKEGRALSAEEVAAGLGISRVSARRYLDYLARTGRTELEAKYGAVGRPVHKYRLLSG
ncbi:MAG: response regulator [Clostridia bacterium]|nr:response regulator [Clostridia bacterium]MBC7346678.1 response regulator [Clostridia bacterium]